MIVPKIIIHESNLPTDPAQQKTEIIRQLQHWSLFGKVALSGVDSLELDLLEAIIQQTGGRVELQIELKSPTEPVALALLNAGASAILCLREQAGSLPGVPADRLIHLADPSQQALQPGDQVEDSQPTAGHLASLEKNQVDCTVDAGWLATNPELIADFLAESLVSDRPDGLWSTLIVDPLGQALGLAYSNYESLLDAITHRRGTYWSRSRDQLWIKGASSGATQQLLGIRLDCDRDCLRFQVTQGPPGFCHRQTHSCFGDERTIVSVIQRLAERIESADEKSFTRKLVNDPGMLQKKLLEEAQELVDADNPDETTWEAADVLYFSLVKMLSQGVRLEQVYQELARRMNRVVRRGPGIKQPN